MTDELRTALTMIVLNGGLADVHGGCLRKVVEAIEGLPTSSPAAESGLREAATCGSPAIGGPCVLPRAHNMGRADIPEYHRAAPAVAQLDSDLPWRQAVIAVVEACDTELEGGAASDFERGADAAYNWVLSVIGGEVIAAVRALRATPGDLQPDREDVK